MKICVYGGQFGSEGKGSIAEALINKYHTKENKLVVFGENSPNSGHTNSVGKTKNIPVSAFFADAVVMGPDSVIDADSLVADINAVLAYKASVGNDKPFQIYIHQNAALMTSSDAHAECFVVSSISSTGSGSGNARVRKQFNRLGSAIVGETSFLQDTLAASGLYCVSVINTNQYFMLIDGMADIDLIFECSQGALLDVNFGYYPYVTSRSTLARVAIERNGLGMLDWEYCGVYRTFPIRTGGPSGPTGSAETTFHEIGVPTEIATVTKRIRRVFKFSKYDFLLSLTLNRPGMVAFTHLDYIKISPDDLNAFFGWLDLSEQEDLFIPKVDWILSNQTGKATIHE